MERSIAPGSAGQGVEDDGPDVEPGRARRLEREQRVADRPQPGAGRDHDREPERDRQVAHGEPRRERDEQPADALDDDRRGALGGRPHGVEQLDGREAAARELGGEVRGDRGPEAQRRDRLGPLPGDRGQQLVVGRGAAPAGVSSVPVSTGLLAWTSTPRARRPAAIAALTTVLPAPVSVPVTRTPCTGP